MAITLKDISRLSGVATSTVSYILSGRGDAMKISAATQDRVREIARKHHYRANLVAKNLRRRLTRTIGVVFNDLTSSWANQVMAGIDEVLLPAGYQPLIGITMFGREREEKVINAFLAQQVEGLLVQPVHSSGDFYRNLAATSDTPVVFIGDAIEGVPVKAFMADAYQGGRDQVDHLYRLGHRRIAYITNDYQAYQPTERLRGTLDRIAELALEFPTEYLQRSRIMSPEEDRQAALRLLQLPRPPTAVAVFGDYMAFHVLGALREAGSAMSVIGAGNLPEGQIELISLTTVDEPRPDMGRGAARYLLEHLDHRRGVPGNDESAPELYRGKLIERQSTRSL